MPGLLRWDWCRRRLALCVDVLSGTFLSSKGRKNEKRDERKRCDRSERNSLSSSQNKTNECSPTAVTKETDMLLHSKKPTHTCHKVEELRVMHLGGPRTEN
jgi:hypothetical protein